MNGNQPTSPQAGLPLEDVTVDASHKFQNEKIGLGHKNTTTMPLTTTILLLLFVGGICQTCKEAVNLVVCSVGITVVRAAWNGPKDALATATQRLQEQKQRKQRKKLLPERIPSYDATKSGRAGTITSHSF